MKWLINFLNDIALELKAAFAQLKRAETWFALGLLTLFGLLAYAVTRFAFKTDSVLLYLHHSMATCRQLSNGPIIFLFCGMIFFALTTVLSLGEFQRYFDCRKHAAHYEARRALIAGICWGVVAIGITLAALLFFNNYCR